MKKILLVLCTLFLAGCEYSKGEEPQSLEPLEEIQLGEQKFWVKVARTGEEQKKGLMWRKDLRKNMGMLFVFPQRATYSFWMKNTKIPLDIFWIDEDGAITYRIMATPCKKDPCPTYFPGANAAKYVLELNPGVYNGPEDGPLQWEGL